MTSYLLRLISDSVPADILAANFFSHLLYKAEVGEFSESALLGFRVRQPLQRFVLSHFSFLQAIKGVWQQFYCLFEVFENLVKYICCFKAKDAPIIMLWLVLKMQQEVMC